MTDKEVMQMALDWANKHGEVVFAGGGWDSVNSMNEWTSEVYARLSQCERCGEVNPAEIHTCTPTYIDRRQWLYDPMTGEVIPLYTAPPQRQQRTYTLRKWQGLTDEDIRKLSDDCAGVRDETEFIRAIETKLKEKNT